MLKGRKIMKKCTFLKKWNGKWISASQDSIQIHSSIILDWYRAYLWLEKPTFWISNFIFFKKMMLKGRKIMKDAPFWKKWNGKWMSARQDSIQNHSSIMLYWYRAYLWFEKPKFWISNFIFWKQIMLKGRKIMKNAFFWNNEIGNRSLQTRVR